MKNDSETISCDYNYFSSVSINFSIKTVNSANKNI
jgi:hypothetical protein